MQEADSKGFGAIVIDAVEGGEDGFLIKGGDDLSCRVQALGDFETEAAFDDGARWFVKAIVELGRAEAAEFENVSKPLGGEEGGFGAFGFKNGVGGDGGAVNDLGDGGGGEIEGCQEV